MASDKKMTKVKMVCEYDGKGYSGWAKAPTNPKPSIQGTIEAAWRKLFPQTTYLSVKTSSRTDSGVHALGQVITIESDLEFGDIEAIPQHRAPAAERRRERKLAKKIGSLSYKSEMSSSPGTVAEVYKRLNGYLPEDIVMRSSKSVPLSFSAKDHSMRRMYRYEILNSPNRPALGRSYVWYIKNELDISLMDKAACLLVGTHDMACFCPNSYHPDDSASTVRSLEVSRLLVSEDKRRLTYEVIGKSFMYKQVRNMVGAIAAVGMGKITLEEFEAVLRGGRRVAIQGAPAHGLTLVWVEHSEASQILNEESEFNDGASNSQQVRNSL